MKRVGNLWGQLTSWQNLYEAAIDASVGKRRRPDVARYLGGLENNVTALRRQLQAGDWHPGSYRHFEITEPKPRLISAAPFRDRVVHHALVRILEPVFEKRFSHHSYACRKGLGTHKAVAQAFDACQRHEWVLQCDIRKFFASIDHEILLGQLARVIKCEPTLALAARIIGDPGALPDSGGSEGPEWFPGDILFTPADRRKGLPLGNQTSQFFANVYLDRIDQFAYRQLGAPQYVRYVDDFLVFGHDKGELWQARERLIEQAATLRLRLHPRKTRAHKTAGGITFLGWRMDCTHKRVCSENVVSTRRRLRHYTAAFHHGKMDFAEVRNRVCSWLGHASHGDTVRLRQRVLDSVKLVGAVRIRNSRRVLEQQFKERASIES